MRFNTANFITRIANSNSSYLMSLTIDGDLILESMNPALAYYLDRKDDKV